MAHDVIHVALAVFIVGHRQHAAVLAEPFDPPHAVAGLAVTLPERGVGAGEAEHYVLHAIERQIVSAYFQHHDQHIGVVKEIEVASMDRELVDESVGERQPGARDIAATIDPDTRFSVLRGFLARRRAVQEPLHERQERHEFLVVTLLEFGCAEVELAVPVLPRIAFLDPLQRLPVPLHRALRP